jgi:hypothetical protein
MMDERVLNFRWTPLLGFSDEEDRSSTLESTDNLLVWAVHRPSLSLVHLLAPTFMERCPNVECLFVMALCNKDPACRVALLRALLCKDSLCDIFVGIIVDMVFEDACFTSLREALHLPSVDYILNVLKETGVAAVHLSGRNEILCCIATVEPHETQTIAELSKSLTLSSDCLPLLWACYLRKTFVLDAITPPYQKYDVGRTHKIWIRLLKDPCWHEDALAALFRILHRSFTHFVLLKLLSVAFSCGGRTKVIDAVLGSMAPAPRKLKRKRGTL